MHQNKMILTFSLLSLVLGMAWGSVVNPSEIRSDVPSPTPQGLPDEFTPLPNRGVVNNELEQYRSYNSQTDDFLQLGEIPGINFSVSRVDALNGTVINGTYSCRLSYRNYGKAPFTSYFYQNYFLMYPILPNIRENATLALNWYLESIDNYLTTGQDYVRVNLYLNNSRYLRYYLGGYEVEDINSYHPEITGHNTTLAWVYTWRNLTQDYIDKWGSFAQDVGVQGVYIELVQSQYRNIPIISYFDNMSLVIEDATIIPNGDFEVVDIDQRPQFWTAMIGNDVEYNPSSIKHVNSGRYDTHAVNISTQITSADANRFKVSYATLAATWLQENRTQNNCSEQRPMKLALNYKIENVLQPGDAWAFIRFTFYNNTAYQTLSFHFYNTLFYTGAFDNESDALNIMLDNQTNTWLTADVDLWPYLSSINYGLWSQLYGLEYQVICYGNANANFSILLDSMGLQTSTFGDAQFEHPVELGKINGWTAQNLRMNYTEFGYSSTNGGNFSMDGSYGHISAQSQCQYLTHGLTKGLTFDADYLIPNLNGNIIDGVTWAMYFTSWDGANLKAIAYTLAWTDSSQFSGNGTIGGRYFLDNQVGIWKHFERNLYSDFEELFPTESPDDYYVYLVSFLMQSLDWSHPLYFLVDNLNFKINNDPDPPRITSVTLNPSPPKAGTPLTVTAHVIDDGIGVDAVTLMYSSDTGTTWQSKAMTSCGADNYCATIENLAENTILSYNVIATDEFGNTAQSMTGGASTMVVVVPSLSFWEAFLVGALVAGGALAAAFIMGKVRQAKKSKAGRAVPAAGLTSATKQQ